MPPKAKGKEVRDWPALRAPTHGTFTEPMPARTPASFAAAVARRTCRCCLHVPDAGGTLISLSSHLSHCAAACPRFVQVSFNQGKFYRRKKELTDDQLNEIQDSFDLFVKDDKDAGDVPKIDAEDLLVVMRALGHEPQPSELKKLVQEVDPENTGQLDFDGYLNIILNKMAERPSQDDLHKAFRLFDPAGKRRITFDDLKRIAGQIGEDIEDGELEDMIKEADHSGSGEINQEDFFKIVTSCTHAALYLLCSPLHVPLLPPARISSQARLTCPSVCLRSARTNADAKHYDGDR
jgi:centrin-1